MPLDQNTVQLYGGKLRIRVCGLLFDGDSILLVKHRGMGGVDGFWAPPGGGMEFGSPASDNLIREFREETGLGVEVAGSLFVFEYLAPPLHSVELFFSVTWSGGTLSKGIDPEYSAQGQIIEEVRFVTFHELGIMPVKSLHHIFTLSPRPKDLLKMRGYFIFEK